MKKGNQSKGTIRSFGEIENLAKAKVFEGSNVEVGSCPQETIVFSLLCQFYRLIHTYTQESKSAKSSASKVKIEKAYQMGFCKLLEKVNSDKIPKVLNLVYRQSLCTLLFCQINKDPCLFTFFKDISCKDYDDGTLSTIDKFSYFLALVYWQNSDDSEQSLGCLMAIMSNRNKMFNEISNLESITEAQEALLNRSNFICDLIGKKFLVFIECYQPKLTVSKEELEVLFQYKELISFERIISMEKIILDMLHILSSPESKRSDVKFVRENFETLGIAFNSVDNFIFYLFDQSEKYKENIHYKKILNCFLKWDSQLKELSVNNSIKEILDEKKEIAELKEESLKLKGDLESLIEKYESVFLSIRTDRISFTNKISESRKKYTEFKEKLEKLELYCKKLEVENSSLQDKIIRETHKIKKIRKENKSCLSKKRKEYEKWKSKVDSKKSKFKEETAQLSTNKEHLEIQIKELECGLIKSSELLSAMEVESNTLSICLQENRSLICELNSRLLSEQSREEMLDKELSKEVGQCKHLMETKKQLEIHQNKISHFSRVTPRDTPENERIIIEISRLSRQIQKLQISNSHQQEHAIGYSDPLDVKQNNIRLRNVYLKIEDARAEQHKYKTLIKQEVNGFNMNNPEQMLVRVDNKTYSENVYRVCQKFPFRMCILLSDYISNKRELNKEFIQAIYFNINSIHKLPLVSYIKAIGIVFNEANDEERLNTFFSTHEKVVKGLFPFIKEIKSDIKCILPGMIQRILVENSIQENRHKNMFNSGLTCLATLLVALGRMEYRGFSYEKIFKLMCKNFDMRFKGDRGVARGISTQHKIEALFRNEFERVFNANTLIIVNPSNSGKKQRLSK